MRLAADNLWATVQDATEEELNWLASYLSVPVKNAEHSDAYQAGHWDGLVRLFDKRRQRFASGLIRMVYGRAKEGGIRVVVDDVRVKPGAPIDPAAGAWLRDYQWDALGAMLARGRGIVQLPTGAGKSELAAAMVQAVPVPWVILVNTKDLMHQMAERIQKRTGERAGTAGDGSWNPRRVTVVTLQSMIRGLGQDGRVDALLDDARGLISDETQCISSSEFHKVAMATPRAWWRFGLSATALEREDENDFRAIEALGPMIHEIKADVLIDAGHLARPEIFFVEFNHEKMTGTYAEVYEAGVCLSDRRNELVTKLAADPGISPRPSLVFFRTVSHGRRLGKLITPLARTEVISGVHNTHQRDGARQRLAFGETDVLVCSKIFNLGIDLPEVESMVNAAGGASTIDSIQRLGRGMRVVKGKTTVRYWDILDRGNRWLADHSRRRLDAFRERGYSVSIIGQSDVAAIAARGIG